MSPKWDGAGNKPGKGGLPACSTARHAASLCRTPYNLKDAQDRIVAANLPRQTPPAQREYYREADELANAAMDEDMRR